MEDDKGTPPGYEKIPDTDGNYRWFKMPYKIYLQDQGFYTVHIRWCVITWKIVSIKDSPDHIATGTGRAAHISIKIIGLEDKFTGQGKREELLKSQGLAGHELIDILRLEYKLTLPSDSSGHNTFDTLSSKK